MKNENHCCVWKMNAILNCSISYCFQTKSICLFIFHDDFMRCCYLHILTALIWTMLCVLCSHCILFIFYFFDNFSIYHYFIHSLGYLTVGLFYKYKYCSWCYVDIFAGKIYNWHKVSVQWLCIYSNAFDEFPTPTVKCYYFRCAFGFVNI